MAKKRTVKSKVIFPVWVETEVSDEEWEAIQNDNAQIIDEVQDRILSEAEDGMIGNTIKPELDCEESRLCYNLPD